MNERTISPEHIAAYAQHLRAEERAPGTIEKYLRDMRAFAAWLDGRPVTKESAAGWKERLVSDGYAPATVNSMLSSINALFRFAGWDDCKVKFLKIQKQLFRDQSRELTRGEYERLLSAAHALGRERLALLMEAVCASGIRVREVKYITVEAAGAGRAQISLKGKIRTIMLPGKLCRKLLKYAKKQKTVSGEIFLTRNGKPLTRRQIWAEMKALCKHAGVEPSKVFPHNLRHLFARTFYRACRDVAKLADVLGHSSIEAARVYLVTTGAEHQRQLDRAGLVGQNPYFVPKPTGIQTRRLHSLDASYHIFPDVQGASGL